VKELAWEIGVHIKTVLVLGTEAVEVELTGLHFFAQHSIVAERAVNAFLTPTLKEEFANYRLSDWLDNRVGFLLFKPFFLEFRIFTLLFHFLLDRIDGDKACGLCCFVITLAFKVVESLLLFVIVVAILCWFTVFFFGYYGIDKVAFVVHICHGAFSCT